MKKAATLIFLLPLGLISNLQAETTFEEGARDVVTLHPSCRTENTGLTAMGIALPNGPEVKVTADFLGGDSPTSFTMSLPRPDILISTDRKGDVFNANPIMGASPSFNQAALFGTDTIKGTVPTYGSRDTTEDTRMVFWKLKGVNHYDIDTNTLMSLPYVPEGELITLELGFALPKFAPNSCLVSLNVRGTQVARCDQIDPVTKTLVANAEPDIRTKRMRLTAERNLEKNPLPAHCGAGIDATIEPTDAEAELVIEKVKTMTP